MKKQKRMSGKGVLSYIGSSHVTFEQSIKLFESIHNNFGFSMALEAEIVTESSLPTGYSSSTYRELH
jgi:hypothetical protein